MLTILIIGYILYNLSDAWGDVSIELGKQTQWHIWGAVQVALFYLAISYLAFGISWLSLLTFTVLSALRFPMFNIMHNLIKGDKWDHLSDKGIDGFVKRLLRLK